MIFRDKQTHMHHNIYIIRWGGMRLAMLPGSSCSSSSWTAQPLNKSTHYDDGDRSAITMTQCLTDLQINNDFENSFQLGRNPLQTIDSSSQTGHAFSTM